MSRAGTCPRVNSRGVFGILLALLLAARALEVGAYSCHEVRAAFQMRQVGPLHRVPEIPGTDVDLLVCKHQGPSCCTRKMEESYQFAVKRETLHNIYVYSYELKHLIASHSDTFQDMFQYLLSFSQGHLSSLLEGTYTPLSHQALPHVNQLFASLSLYLRGANVSVEATVNQFFNNLFPLVYTRLINPGIVDSTAVDREMTDCLRMIRQDVNPFGPHPSVMAQELSEAISVGRQMGLFFEEGLEVLNATEHITLTKDCVKGLVKMVYCSHCRGLTLIKPCVGYCLNVMRGCLASISELDQPWRRYTNLLEQLTHAMVGHHSLELALLGMRGHVNEALLYAQLHGPLITATVDKVCGLTTRAPTGMQPTGPEVTTPSGTSPTQLPSAAPFKPLPEQWLGRVAHLRKDFLMYLQRYKSFYAALPEMLCEGENVVDDATCWSGDEVVESYAGRVVGNGLHAQRQNPEVKVRTPNPSLAEVKERLENFNQETQEKFPNLGQFETWEELGSAETEGSTSDCDDEDGCQASGNGQDTTLHTKDSSEVGSIGPGLDGPKQNPAKPPSVRVIGNSPPSSWSGLCSLALPIAALCWQWTLF
ncbi:glypican-5-like isoform X3 [Corythoichthys intestinalis]|uniref:glypican-5-like isoform X3 n=1 Tax=Corythoichthys intestinalis TaxID=161448 RepID=UPI0025A61537|nr:glypican-5-like isoform X3 [Corythoichthys intestinalis]